MLALSRLKNSVALREVAAPRPAQDEALIRVSLAGVCNTDLEIARGYMGFEGTLGHEFVGVVEECADASWLGARVAGEINLACRQCSLCRRGLSRHCPERTVLGILGKDGAFAQYVSLPVHNLHRVPDALTDRAACFVEPIAACFEILEQVRVQPEDQIVVLGDGKLGLLAALVLRSQGLSPVLLGKHPDKLARARQLGVKTAFAADLPRKAHDVVIEATGSPTGMQLAIELVRPRGTLVLKSTYHGALTLDAAPLVIDEISLIGSRCGPFPPALAQLAARTLDPEPLVDAVYPLREAPRALEHAAERGVLKVLLSMTD
jgi:threonine dehydrogenase-like Zn-dependent dehydrogenase